VLGRRRGVGPLVLPGAVWLALLFLVPLAFIAVSTIIVAVTALAILIAWRLGAFGSGKRRPATEDS
jgi:hypothetical protein